MTRSAVWQQQTTTMEWRNLLGIWLDKEKCTTTTSRAFFRCGRNINPSYDEFPPTTPTGVQETTDVTRALIQYRS